MSDSDESDVVPSKRKRLYNIDDTDDSSSDACSVIVRPTKCSRRRLNETSSDTDSEVPIKRQASKSNYILSDSDVNEEFINETEDSDWESDWSSDNTDDIVQKLNKSENATEPEANYAYSGSDSSDEHCEKCPICLLRFTNQEVATPETCEHVFCFECLQEWSKNVSNCPIDRKDFEILLVRKDFHSEHKREVKVVKKKVEEEVLEDTTFCEICRHSDREDSMLLCDGCDHGFHMECLTPQLTSVPLGDWFCDSCAESNNTITDDADSDEGPITRVPRAARTHTNSSRQIPRTMQSERVRSTVESLRRQARQYTLIDIFDPDQPSTSSGSISRETSKPKTRKTIRSTKSVSKRSSKKVTKRKRKVRRKRRTYVKEYEICQETGAKILVKKLVSSTRKTKRRKRKSSKKTSKRNVKSSRSRKSSSPIKKSRASSENAKVISTGTTLHLFGRRDELDYFSDESNTEVPVAPKEIITKTLPMNYKPKKKVEIKDRKFTPASSSISLLDSIMESQEQWHSKKTCMALERDGKIVVQNKQRS